MADNVREHERALRAMQRRGVAVTFPPLSGSSYNPSMGTWSTGGAGTAVDGYAVEKPMDPEEFKELSQIVSSPVLLMFIPNTYGMRPVNGQTLAWAGKKRTVAQVLPIRPTEEALGARVVLA